MSSERMANIKRYTTETKIDLFLDIDGEGRYDVDTGCGFLNHMLELFARHGNFIFCGASSGVTGCCFLVCLSTLRSSVASPIGRRKS